MAAVRQHEHHKPVANLLRIMRKILPPHAKISDEAKETIQDCVSEYIMFITAEANDRCQQEHRKTVTADDVLWAMEKLGLDDYVHSLSNVSLCCVLLLLVLHLRSIHLRSIHLRSVFLFYLILLVLDFLTLIHHCQWLHLPDLMDLLFLTLIPVLMFQILLKAICESVCG